MLMQKELKKTYTYRMNDSTVKMLDEIKQATGISKSEILAQFVQSYYKDNNLKLKSKKESEVSSRVATNKAHFAE